MDITDMLSSADGARSIEMLTRRFGLTPDQTRSAIDQLAPAVMAGIRGETRSADGLSGLLAALVEGDHARYVAGNEENIVEDGNGILGHIFGSKDVSRGVAAEAARETGLNTDTMKEMLPMIASMVMGALGKNLMGDQAGTKGGGLAEILGQVLGPQGAAPAGAGGGLEEILGQVLGGSTAGRQPAGAGGLGDLLNQLGGGGGARPGGSGAGDTDLGGLLGSLFGGDNPSGTGGRASERARDTIGAMLGGSTPRGSAGDKMLDKVKKDLGHA